jgi:DNA ligase (NAD+)
MTDTINKSKNNSEIQKLKNELHQARLAYYNMNPIISDQEYDAKKTRLASLEPQNEEITAIGAPPPQISVWEKIKHKMPMGSLDKVNTSDEFMEWIQTTKCEEFLFTHKIDGSSLELVYENGSLIRGVTRGDGKIGEDITQNIKQIPSIPNEISDKLEVIVRGEVVMLKEIFQKYYSDCYANPRNTAAGKVRDKKKSGIDCKNLNFYAFSIMKENALSTEVERFKQLEYLGFEVPSYGKGTYEEAIEWYQHISTTRDSVPYEIDGVVIRVDDIEKQESLGEINMRPRGQIAWKFDPIMGTTKVINVKWNVGLTGRICPVMIVEPVDVGGVVITNVSLHNLAMFKKLNLSQNDEVLISRRNDVIPYCEKNITKGINASDT